MKLIKLHLTDNHPVWVNPKSVSSVAGDNEKGGMIFIGANSYRLVLSETPEEVVKLLEECE